MFGRDDDHTGARIKEQRKLARLTQRQLADRLPDFPIRATTLAYYES